MNEFEGLEDGLEGLEAQLEGAAQMTSVFDAELARMRDSMVYTQREVGTLSSRFGSGIWKSACVAPRAWAADRCMWETPNAVFMHWLGKMAGISGRFRCRNPSSNRERTSFSRRRGRPELRLNRTRTGSMSAASARAAG